MRLTRAALLIIKGFSVEKKEELAIAAGVGIKTIYRWLDENNDGLTKAGVVKMIRQESGLNDEEILEDEKVSAKIGH